MAENHIKVGVAGLVHDHVWDELKKWQATGRVRLVAAADPHEQLLQRAEEEFGIDRHFADYRQMLEEMRPHVVEICTSNAEAVDVVASAAGLGIHVVVEKPMAATLEQAERMVRLAEDAGILLFINWPNRWRPGTLQSWQIVNDGAIGHVFTARMRMAHCGPREMGCSPFFCEWLYDASRNGGGALIDYCCYGAAAFRHLFGMPQAVQAVAERLIKHDIPVEDNAAITLLYSDRFAFAEASWTQIPSYHDAIYLGEKGTLWTDRGTIRIATDENDVREVSAEPLPEGYRTGPEAFLTCLDRDREPPDVCHPRLCRDVQEILAAGQQAAASGARVELPLASPIGGDV